MEAPRAEFRVQEGRQRGPFHERNAAESKAKRPVKKPYLKNWAEFLLAKRRKNVHKGLNPEVEVGDSNLELPIRGKTE